MCNTKFSKDDDLPAKGQAYNPLDYKVRDHCHFSNKYRGAAHLSCNGSA